jgi:hypothetical protein
MKISDYNVRKVHRFNFTALPFGFVLFLSVLVLSAFFIINGMEVQGSIFGGSAIIAGIVFFIKAMTNNRK